MSDGEHDEFIERSVGEFLDRAARSRTVQEADHFLATLRGAMAVQLGMLRRERADPRVVEPFTRLLGRLVDATGSGGTRR